MAALLEIDATINQHIAYIQPDRSRLRPAYLHLFLKAAYRELRAISGASGSTKDALTCEALRSFRVALPPLAEQDRLLEALGGERERIDRELACVRRQISLAAEYRTRLIAGVVTGKLDVREAAAALPDLDPADDGADVKAELDGAAAVT